jgi:hypothetical protein
MVTSWIRNRRPDFAVRGPGALYEICRSSSMSRTVFQAAAAQAELTIAMTAVDRRPLGWQASALTGTSGLVDKDDITHANEAT